MTNGFSAALDASRRIAFSGNIIDRQAENRADDAAQQALEETGARLLLLDAGRILLRFDAGGRAHACFGREQAALLEAKEKDAILLGYQDKVPVLAVPVDSEKVELPADIRAVDYRSVYRQDLLDQITLGALAQAGALVAWHASHRYCGCCGAETQMRAGGYKRVCQCGREHFPRTDPVVIMLATRGDRCLLGRGPHFAPGLVSCLAGFVEPGETIEDAVRREIAEESGIAIGRVTYHASQPWPFPYSLMIGCYAQAISEEIAFDDNELEDCRWFSRQTVARMLAGDNGSTLTVPPRGAIANLLIRDWVEAGA